MEPQFQSSGLGLAIMIYLKKMNCNPAPYLDITSWSHKKLIDLIRAEFPEDVLREEINISIS